MASELAGKIADLPPLDRRAPFQAIRPCKICGGDAIAFTRVDFNKFCDTDHYDAFGLSGIDIDYLRCLACGFIFTCDFDDWSHADFSALIYNRDYVKVDADYVLDRPARTAVDFAHRLRGCEQAAILDYGSGAGIFADHMRAAGFANVQAYDPFSSPQAPQGLFDIVTSFEVIEHSPDPVQTLAAMRRHLRDDGCILVGQTVQPPDILAIRGSWWYLAPRNGHVSTYSEEALLALGRQNSLMLHKGDDLYGFAPTHPSSFACHALGTVGPSLTILRLLAPRARLSREIAFPSADNIIWHGAEDDGVWAFRWTGTATVGWECRWESASLLQVRVPVMQAVTPDFLAGCTLELNGRRMKMRPDRGEYIAEFDVRGLTHGPILLHTPDPVGAAGRALGLAVLISQTPGRADAAAAA